MHIWMTGATGLIGTALLPLLLEDGHRVTSLGRRSPEVSDRISWEVWDAERLVIDFPRVDLPDALIHLSSQTSSYVAREDIARDLTVNVLGPLRLIEDIAKHKQELRVLTAGSITEKYVNLNANPDSATTYYEIGKTSLNLYLSQLRNEGRIKYLSLRLSNVYGGSRSSQTDRGFLDRLISMALEGRQLEYFSDGDYIRDYVHVNDVAEAFRTALLNFERLSEPYYEIGSGVGTSIGYLVERVAQSVGTATATRPVAVIPVDPPQSLPAIERQDRISSPETFEILTGWNCKVDLNAGINMAIDSKLRFN